MKRGLVFWFTGLSGSGKTTIAEAIKPMLEEKGFSTFILDGDEVRERLHMNLGFSPSDIRKNNSLIVQLCIQNRAKYDIILVPIISPYASSRLEARRLLGEGFYEIYFAADLETVILRDPKGLYAKARDNLIKNMIGYSPSNIYEPPVETDFVINSQVDNVDKSVNDFFKYILLKFRIP